MSYTVFRQDLPTRIRVDPIIADGGCSRPFTRGFAGVSYEARKLADSAGLEFVATRDPRLDVDKSAGPSTCALLSVSAEESGSVARELSVPVTETGTLA